MTVRSAWPDQTPRLVYLLDAVRRVLEGPLGPQLCAIAGGRRGAEAALVEFAQSGRGEGWAKRAPGGLWVDPTAFERAIRGHLGAADAEEPEAGVRLRPHMGRRPEPLEQARTLAARLVSLQTGDGEPDPDVAAIAAAPAFADAVAKILGGGPDQAEPRAFGLLKLLTAARRRSRQGRPLDAGLVRVAEEAQRYADAAEQLLSVAETLTRLSTGHGAAETPVGWQPPSLAQIDWRKLVDVAGEGLLAAMLESIARDLKSFACALRETPVTLLVPDGAHARGAHLPEEDLFGARGRALVDQRGRDTGALVREVYSRLSVPRGEPVDLTVEPSAEFPADRSADLGDDYPGLYALIADLCAVAGYPCKRQSVRRLLEQKSTRTGSRRVA